MAKVLLINSVIREFAPPNNVPLGVLYIASVLKQNKHQVDICDLNAYRTINPEREFWLRIYKKKYDIIGISGLISTYQEQKHYVNYIREHYQDFGRPLIISGGSLATSAPEFTLNNLAVDCVALNEGEMTMLELCNGDAFSKIAGLAYRGSDGSIIYNAPRVFIENLDDIPFPCWDDIPIEIYLKNPIWGAQAGNSSRINYIATRSMNMIVSRGCPYSCNFCYHYVFGKKYRLRSVDNVIAEIQLLKNKYDIDFVGFVDDNTTSNREWVLDFCNAMIDKKWNIKWGCSARVNAVDPEMLKAMKEAGCEWIGFGIESASPKILAKMNKKTTPEIASQAIKMVRDAGIWANTTFIAGYLDETVDDLRMTAKFMKENDCLNNMFFATPYPGTTLFEQCKDKIIEQYGDIDKYIASLADATDFRVNISAMKTDELMEYRSKAIEGIAF